MEAIIRITLESGKSAVDLALYVLLPIIVLMMVFMEFLTIVGILPAIERKLAKVLRYVGLPARGVVAMMQLLFVNFAAPYESLRAMNSRTGSRELAATLAMVLAMAQANATFPLVADGLSLWIIPISVAGGLVASVSTYYLFAPKIDTQPVVALPDETANGESGERSAVGRMITAGNEGVWTALKAIPFLLLGIGLMNLLREFGADDLLESALAPLLTIVGLPETASLPIIAKYLAGGTAMLGVSHDLIEAGSLSAQDLNRMAGFLINPVDFVGLPMLLAAGERVRSVLKPAMLGVACGITARFILHIVVF